MNLFYVFEQGNPVLVATFLLLIAMSAVSWYVILWKGWKLWRERQRLQRFRRRFMQRPDWPLHSRLEHIPGSVALLVQTAQETQPLLAGYDTAERRNLLSMHLSQRLDSIRVWLDKGLTILASIGSSAPFIGLFGTVWGIYNALTHIAAQGNASLNVVAGPMGEALVATAIGLFAAIPAVLAYNGFVRANRVLVQDIRHIAEQMTAYLSQEKAASDTVKLVAGRA